MFTIRYLVLLVLLELLHINVYQQFRLFMLVVKVLLKKVFEILIQGNYLFRHIKFLIMNKNFLDKLKAVNT